MYDYLLVVGPGRSGSEFLFRLLRAHPDYVFPEIKEGAYYRSVAGFERARAKVRPPAILCDIANDAYRDAKLPARIGALSAKGHAVLVMVLLRDQRQRAVSMMNFRRSRGRPAALLGAARLEASVIRDRLTPERLERIFDIDSDILAVGFESLVGAPAWVGEVLASLCGTAGFGEIGAEPVNPSVRARFVWLSTLGWLAAVVLRRLGLKTLLQRIKDSELVGGAFFRPVAEGGAGVVLSEESTRLLDAGSSACWSLVKRSSARLGEGLYLRRREAVR